MPRSTGISEVLEERITIAGADVNLEGRLALGGGPGGVVITHPHPMYGGTMDNNVVWTAARAFQARDWTTLRFNFRGVGLSSGEHGDGMSEMADVQAALAYLESADLRSVLHPLSSATDTHLPQTDTNSPISCVLRMPVAPTVHSSLSRQH